MRVNYLVVGFLLLGVGIFLSAVDSSSVTGFVFLNNSDGTDIKFAGAYFIFAGFVSIFLSINKKVKGQAAMEFLMTYGWAILSSLIALGVLSLFGIFSSDSLIGSSASIGIPFYMDAWRITESEIELGIRNSGPEDYIIKQISVSLDDGSTICHVYPDTLLESNKNGEYAIPCLLEEGDSLKGDIDLKYVKTTSQLIQSVQGKIKDKVYADSIPLETYSLTINILGEGSVSCNGVDCESSYNSGTPVTLVATPSPNYDFSGWNGAGCSGTGECIVLMESNLEVTATFSSEVVPV